MGLDYLPLFSISDFLGFLLRNINHLLLKVDINHFIKLFAVVCHRNFRFLLRRWCGRIIIVIIVFIDLSEYFRFVLNFILFVLNVFKCSHANLCQIYVKGYQMAQKEHCSNIQE